MDDLIAWLRDRLDEDERIALDWQSARLILTEQYINDPTRNHVRAHRKPVTDAQRVEYAYNSRFDPARTLREVEAKREILALYESAQLSAQVAEGTVLAGGTRARRGAYKVAVQTLALAYSTHSGYRQEWKP